MSGDPRDILRLKHCPQCGYDLATLPRKHRCPECGFEYDDSMFIITGDARRPRITRGELAAYAALILCFIIAIVTPGIVGGIPLFGWLLAWGSVSFFGWLYRRWLRRTRGGDTSLLVTDDRVRWLSGGWPRRSHPWCHFAQVTARRPRSPSVNPFGRPDRTPTEVIFEWRIRFVPLWWRRIYSPGIDIRVRYTQREAARLRAALRDKLRAAARVRVRR
ncbi:MAG: hypothetical protein IH830_10495 [Planctomycetes bacterium]|nr:hypothetical protein [Planctomycetota bacterium]